VDDIVAAVEHGSSIRKEGGAHSNRHRCKTLHTIRDNS